MDAIVSVSANWGIGYKGQLVVSNREDMRRFVRLTQDSTVVMGRTTFESFSGGPLKGRRNIVVTRDAAYTHTHPGIECASSPEKALEMAAADAQVWLIGGEQLYRALLPSCEAVEVTMNEVTPTVDAWFPNLDEDSAWKLEKREEGGVTEEGVRFEYRRYLRC